MRTSVLVTAVILLVFAGSFWARDRWLQPRPATPPALGPPQRIISLAPSITETLFALGLGDRVVGVSRFCHYPPEAGQKPHVGGYLDPNLEAIVALRPDLVVLLQEHEQSTPGVKKLGLRTLFVRHQDVEGILDSLGIIGRSCGAEAKAAALRTDIERRLSRIGQQTAGLRRPRVLVAVDRTLGAGRLQDVYFAGSNGHLNQCLELAGGENACRFSPASFPVISSEGILRLNPEVIIDIVSEQDLAKWGEAAILADWQQLPQLDAVQHGRVCLLTDDHALLPGPSFIELVEHFARMIPEKGSVLRKGVSP